MKKIYEKAIELLQPEFLKGIDTDGTEIDIKLSHANYRTEYEGFEFIFNESGEGYNRFIKVMKKDVGFTFKVMKNDPEDLNRMQFVYDVTIACKNNQILLPLAKKVKPDYRKIEKRFPGKITNNEYNSLDIHNKESVISMITKILDY